MTKAPWQRSVMQQKQLLIGIAIGALVSLLLRPLFHERKWEKASGSRSDYYELQTMHNITVLAPRLRRQHADEWDSYQDFIVKDTEIFRPKADMSHFMAESFFEKWQELRAADADLGDRIFLPINWYECHYTCTKEARERLPKYVPNLDKRWKYFTLCGIDKGLAYWLTHVPPDLDLLVFSSDGATRNARDIRVPLMTGVLRPKGLEKNITVSAAFSVGTHRIRPKVMELWKEWVNEPGFVQMNFSSKEQYAELLERSTFTLAPRGIGPTSFRMIEALQVGTIPIYIWEYDLVLPYQDIINWMDISIVVHPDDLGDLRGKIDNFNVTRAQEILPRIQHMFDYPYINEYVVRRLQTEVLSPVPVSAFADDGHHDRRR